MARPPGQPGTEPAQESGKSRWIGSSVPLVPELCSRVRGILRSREVSPAWSRRSLERVTELRHELSEFCGDDSTIGHRGAALEWWTFAGLAANQTVVQYLRPHVSGPLRADNLWIRLPETLSLDQLSHAIAATRYEHTLPDWDFSQPASDLLKFADLLPEPMLREMILTRIADVPSARRVFGSRIRAAGS